MMALGRGKRVALGVLLVLLVGGAVAWRVLDVPSLAFVGSGYAAQQTCACLFISKRTLDSCMTDLEPLARKLINVEVGSDEVIAHSFLHLRSATAKYEAGYGCSLQN
jgi:hypothetical protein